MVHCSYCLHLSRMGEHLLAVHIADGVDTLDSSLVISIDRDTLAFIIFYACIYEVCLYTMLTTCSHQDEVCIDVSKVFNSSLHLEGDAPLL